MRLEFYRIEKLKKDVLGIIAKYLDTLEYKAFFFGSRASGKGNQYSDIDIGIKGPQEIPYEIMARIKEDIENLPILYKIEIIDFNKVSPDFQEVALSHQEYL